MKRLSLVVLSFSLLGFSFFGLVNPQTALGVTTVTVRGNINKVVPGPTLAGVANQSVTVTCGSVTKTATTNASGLYTVTFSEAGCGAFSQATSKSTFNASLMTRQVQVSSEGRATIDLNF